MSAARERLRQDPRGDLAPRARQLAADCLRRGEVGILAPDDFADCGRVMVPARVLAALVEAADCGGGE